MVKGSLCCHGHGRVGEVLLGYWSEWGKVPGQRREERGPEWGAALSARVWDWGYEFFKAAEFGFRVQRLLKVRAVQSPG